VRDAEHRGVGDLGVGDEDVLGLLWVHVDPARDDHAARALAPDGACLIVEPYAGDRIEDNLTPLGRVYYAFSTLVCTPGSLSQPGRAGLGTQAGEARLAETLRDGGFASIRRAAETPLNLVLEARLA
jgi:hypothetical protein